MPEPKLEPCWSCGSSDILDCETTKTNLCQACGAIGSKEHWNRRAAPEGAVVAFVDPDEFGLVAKHEGDNSHLFYAQLSNIPGKCDIRVHVTPAPDAEEGKVT